MSLNTVEAFKGFEPIVPKCTEHSTEYEAPSDTQQQMGKKAKKKKKPQGFGGGKYRGGNKGTVVEQEEEPIKPLLIMRPSKSIQIQENLASAESKKPKTKTNDSSDTKINDFVKTVVGGGRTTDESENEGWQRTNINKKPETENSKRVKPKKETKDSELNSAQKNAPK